MSVMILNYAFDSESLANPDGTLPTKATGCTLTSGPGNTSLGIYKNALSFGTSGKIQTPLPVNQLNTEKFCVRTLIKVDTAVSSRQNLVESNALPFSLFLDKASGNNTFKAVVSVAPVAHGWSGTTTEFFTDLKLNTWYLIDLIYDTDTVAVAINGMVLSVHAFPNGKINLWNNNALFIGTWVDGARNHFQGSMAALQIHSDIPLELETQLDEKRNSPEWHMSYKYEQIKPSLNFGQPKAKYTYDPAINAYKQEYDFGLIMYNESIGAAFEMHGAMFASYTAQANKRDLGYLVSDEGNAGSPGSRKNIFSKGGIYWSSATGAVAVTGQIYLDYELMGEAASIGLPVSPATNIAGGKEQIFQRARMYYKTGSPKAHEVHGAILAKFLASGGIQSWGFPTSNESDVKNNNVVMGRFSDFENCTIYWSSPTGAFEVHGDIRQKYRDLKGPLGALGLPTSDEQNIPDAPAPARYNTFQNGSILWFGSWNNMYVCYPFRIFLGRIDSDESEGAFMGQNDIYLRAILEDNNHEILRKRFPDSGDFGGHNVININQQLPITIVPNSPSRIIDFTVDVWESDSGAPFGGGDDHLGVYQKTLKMANAWGLKENQGIFNSGAFDMINAITWSVQPQISEQALSETQKWWGVRNDDTPTLSYSQYAGCFRDVDSDPEWWDLTDWLEKAFYELVVAGLAKSGNCFGMSLEGIYARKHRSIFSLPIDRFNAWNTVVNEFNIKHQYQVGASPIWWFVGQFLSGNTHDPVDVFQSTFNAMLRGDHPVLCIAQNWDFSGGPHCVMPVGWDASTKPWKIQICDPNFPGQVRNILIDPDKNEYTYTGSRVYTGGEWSGGRLHYMPYCVLNERPRTPIWDAILLLLAGTIIILGSDASTESFTDENGNDLDAFGADAIARMKQKKPLDNKFVSFKGFDAAAQGVLASEMYIRSQRETSFFVVNPSVLDTRLPANMTIGELAQNKRLAALVQPVVRDAATFNAIEGRELKAVINDAKVMSQMDPIVVQALTQVVAASNVGKNLRHRLKGKNNGQLKYAVKSKLNQLLLTAPLTSGEINTVNANDLGTSSSVIDYKTGANKLVRLEIDNKLGVGKDKVKILIDRIPANVSKNLQLSIKPGIAGVDILTVGEGAQADVSIQTTINGQLIKRDYSVRLDTGIRIRPSTVLTNNQLKVGRVDNLFGPIRSSLMLKPKS